MWGRGKESSPNQFFMGSGSSGSIIDKYGEIAKSARLLSQALIETKDPKALRQRTDAGIRDFWQWSFLTAFSEKLGSKSLSKIIEGFDDYAIAGNMREGRGELIEALKALSGFTQIPPQGGVNLPAPTRLAIPQKNQEVETNE